MVDFVDSFSAAESARALISVNATAQQEVGRVRGYSFPLDRNARSRSERRVKGTGRANVSRYALAFPAVRCGTANIGDATPLLKPGASPPPKFQVRQADGPKAEVDPHQCAPAAICDAGDVNSQMRAHTFGARL